MLPCLLLEPGEVCVGLLVLQPPVGQGLVHGVAGLVADHQAPLDAGHRRPGDGPPRRVGIHELSVADLILDIHILTRVSSVSFGPISRRISVSHAVSGNIFLKRGSFEHDRIVHNPSI